MSFIKRSVRKFLGKEDLELKKSDFIQSKTDILKNVLEKFFEQQKKEIIQKPEQNYLQQIPSYTNFNENYQDQSDQIDSLIYTQKQDDQQTIDFQLQDRMLDCLQDQKHLSLYRQSKRQNSISKKTDFRRNEQTDIQKMIQNFKQQGIRYSQKVAPYKTKQQQNQKQVIFKICEQISFQNNQDHQPILVGSASSFQERINQEKNQPNKKQNKKKGPRFQKYRLDKQQSNQQGLQNKQITDYFDQVFQIDKKQQNKDQKLLFSNNIRNQIQNKQVNAIQNINTDSSLTNYQNQVSDYMKSSLQINMNKQRALVLNDKKDQTKKNNNDGSYSINIISPKKIQKEKQSKQLFNVNLVKQKIINNQINNKIDQSKIIDIANINKNYARISQNQIVFQKKESSKKLPIIYNINNNNIQNKINNTNIINFNRPIPIIQQNKQINQFINNSNANIKVNFNYNSQKDLTTKINNNQFKIKRDSLPLNYNPLPLNFINQNKQIKFIGNYFNMAQTQQRMPVFLQKLRRINSYCPNLYLKSVNSSQIFQDLKIIISTFKSALGVLDLLFQKLTLRANQIRIFMQTVKYSVRIPQNQQFSYAKKLIQEQVIDYFLKSGWHNFHIDQIKFIRPQQRYQRRTFVNQNFMIALKSFNDNVNHYLNNFYCDLSKQQGKQRYIRIRKKFWQIQKNIKMMSQDIYTYWLVSCNFPYIYEDYMRFLNGQSMNKVKTDSLLTQIVKGQSKNDSFCCSIIGKTIKTKIFSNN